MKGEQLKLTEGYNNPPESTAPPLTIYDGLERRGKPRLYGCFPAMKHEVKRDGETFETNAVITNISASGLYLRLMQSVEPGTALFLVMRFTSAAKATGPLITIHGRVLRVEPQRSGDYGLAVAITHYEFA